MTSLALRPYQEECILSINEHRKQGELRQLVHLPTAAGKTVIFANLIKQLECKTLVLAHTCELLDQASDKIKMICPGLDVGIVKAGRKEYNHPVVVSSIQSARQPGTLEQFKKQGFSLCIYDEAHRAAALTPREILTSLGFLGESEKLLVGFSATPFRNDGRGLGEVFEKIVYQKTIKELIALGYLSHPKGISIKSDLDLSTVTSIEGDFVATSLANVMDTSELRELVVNAYIGHAIDRKAVCFAVSIAHAKNLAEAFKRRGIASEAIHGDTPSEERASLLERFKSGKISVLTNCQILIEGWDCPEVSCVLIAKPTLSKGLYQQMAGRGLRLYPNKKDCLILDFGSKNHSLCSSAILLEDDETFEANGQTEGRMAEFAKKLPESLNKKLRSAIVEFDLFGDAFTWAQEGQSFSLKASGGKTLKILPTHGDLFSVIFFSGNNTHTIAKDISFEYAFSSAEEFSKDNRHLFSVSDLEAPWRTLPISDKQRGLFNSYGFKAGIEDLSRGQAALIISSGVLNKRAVSVI